MRHWNSTVDVRRAKGTIERQLFQPEHIAELRLYGMVRYLLNLRQNLRDEDEKTRIIFERKFILRRLAADAATSGEAVSAADLRSFAEAAGDLADPKVMGAAWQ